MKLSELAPSLTPEQLADHEIKIHVDWANKKVQFVLVNASNEAVAVKQLEKPTTPPTLLTQEHYWAVTHNPWLD